MAQQEFIIQPINQEFTVELVQQEYDLSLARVGPQGSRGPRGYTGHEYSVLPCSENLVAGDYINVWLDGAVNRVRKASANDVDHEAHGFVLVSYTSGASAAVYFTGNNTGVTGQIVGPVFLSLTPGLGSNVPPTGIDRIVQRVGIAASSTQVTFNPQQPIRLAQ
jgi:hypothetical protein